MLGGVGGRWRKRSVSEAGRKMSIPSYDKWKVRDISLRFEVAVGNPVRPGDWRPLYPASQ